MADLRGYVHRVDVDQCIVRLHDQARAWGQVLFEGYYDPSLRAIMLEVIATLAPVVVSVSEHVIVAATPEATRG